MNISKSLLLIAAVLAIALANSGSIYDSPSFVPTRKGLTYRAKVWPRQSNSWTGQMACDRCDPINGDT